ncbi:MAG: hypothetical protein JJE25_13395 [Bacteroidia bacterium]|nr:hypothetical protein [Bacteroidia bacterium]
MITLEQIISSNLEMLKSQEAELQKSLNFVQKARTLFEQQNGAPMQSSTPKQNGAPKRRRRTRTRTVSATPQTPKTEITARKGTHLGNIMNVLKQKGKPMPSGEVITTLFKQQKKDKNIAHYRQLIYPTLTQAYKRGALKLKDGKIHLPA